MLKIALNIGKFFSKNWVPVVVGASSATAGYLTKKYDTKIAKAAKKTGNTVASPFVWTYDKVTGMFRKDKKDETSS